MPQTRISERSHRTLKQLAAETGYTFEQVVDEALARYQRERLLDAINAGYAALRSDPRAWAAEQAERAAWDATLMDGLDAAGVEVREAPAEQAGGRGGKAAA